MPPNLTHIGYSIHPSTQRHTITLAPHTCALRFRCSNHKLDIELGRHTQTSREQLTCRFCTGTSVGDEYHAFKCPQNPGPAGVHVLNGINKYSIVSSNGFNGSFINNVFQNISHQLLWLERLCVVAVFKLTNTFRAFYNVFYIFTCDLKCCKIGFY